MAHPISKSSASKPVKNRKTTRFRTRSRTRSKRGQNEVQKLLGPHQSPKKAERTIFDTRGYRFHYCFVMVLVHVPHACKTQWAHHKHGLISTCWICTKHSVWFWKRTAKRETNRKYRNRTGGKPNRLDCEPQTQTSCKPNRTGTDMIYMKPEPGEPVNFLSHGFTGWVFLRNTCLETAANKGRSQQWDFQKARGPLLRCPVSCMRQKQVIPS